MSEGDLHTTRRVLLVDTDADNRAAIRTLLTELSYEVIAEAAYGADATRKAAQLQPDVILMRLEEPLALSLHALETVQRAAPRSTAVVMSSKPDAEVAGKAMLAGARGYVVVPASAASLEQVLRTACERQQEFIESTAATAEGAGARAEAAGGAVITVFGPKGGVGKTTIATNLALAIRKRTQARVVLVDVDPYFGDVAIMMGVEPERTLLELFREYHERREVDVESYLTEHPSGIYLLAARHTVEIGRQPDPDAIAELLHLLAGWFDFVVVDTPGYFSPQVAAALDESTTILLVTSSDISSLKDARISVDALRNSGFDTDRVKLLVNHATTAQPVGSGEIARAVDHAVLCELPHDRAVASAIQQGVPLVLGDPKAKAAKEINALASYLSGNESEQRARRFWRSRN